MQSPSTLGLALIARDEETTLPRLLASIAGAFDQVALLDTGSTDRTVEVFEDWARRQNLPLGYKVDHFEWRDDFADARNAADALLDTDWLCWADCDDEIEGASRLRGVVKAASPTKLSMIAFQYRLSGNVSELRERLFRRGCGEWHYPIHEIKRVDPNRWVSEVVPELCFWRHHGRHNGRASTERNKRIAHAWLEREPDNPRALFIATREELAFGAPERGVDYARRYLRSRSARAVLGMEGVAAAWRMLKLGDLHGLATAGMVDPEDLNFRGLVWDWDFDGLQEAPS